MISCLVVSMHSVECQCVGDIIILVNARYMAWSLWNILQIRILRINKGWLLGQTAWHKLNCSPVCGQIKRPNSVVVVTTVQYNYREIPIHCRVQQLPAAISCITMRVIWYAVQPRVRDATKTNAFILPQSQTVHVWSNPDREGKLMQKTLFLHDSMQQLI